MQVQYISKHQWKTVRKWTNLPPLDRAMQLVMTVCHCNRVTVDAYNAPYYVIWPYHHIDKHSAMVFRIDEVS